MLLAVFVDAFFDQSCATKSYCFCRSKHALCGFRSDRGALVDDTVNSGNTDTGYPCHIGNRAVLKFYHFFDRYIIFQLLINDSFEIRNFSILFINLDITIIIQQNIAYKRMTEFDEIISNLNKPIGDRTMKKPIRRQDA